MLPKKAKVWRKKIPKNNKIHFQQSKSDPPLDIYIQMCLILLILVVLPPCKLLTQNPDVQNVVNLLLKTSWILPQKLMLISLRLTCFSCKEKTFPGLMNLYLMRHDKKTCASSKDTDQPGHPPSRISVFAVFLKKVGSSGTLKAHCEDSDQTGRMPRMIWVLAWRTWFNWCEKKMDT